MEEAGEPGVEVGVEIGEMVQWVGRVGVVRAVTVSVCVGMWSKSKLVVGEKDREGEEGKKECLL
jgi:hypothetical protein